MIRAATESIYVGEVRSMVTPMTEVKTKVKVAMQKVHALDITR